MRTRALVMVAVLAGLVASSGLAAAASNAAPAFLHGRSIPLGDVHRYHCDDLHRGAIRCFTGAAARDRDVARQEQLLRGPVVGGGGGGAAIASVAYVTFYVDQNYGGSSFTASNTYSNLGDIGWNDTITSFKSLNGGHPEWWVDINFSGTVWQWVAGAQVANVGSSANDRFSSVQNVP